MTTSYRTRIFLGGSRSINDFPIIVEAMLRLEMQDKAQFLIGDAEGADLALQTYLAEWQYQHVLVYAMRGKPRNNVGNWQVVSVLPTFGAPSREFYTAKDKLMARDANWGIMLYDGKSRGTLANIETLAKLSKKCYVFQLMNNGDYWAFKEGLD